MTLRAAAASDGWDVPGRGPAHYVRAGEARALCGAHCAPLYVDDVDPMRPCPACWKARGRLLSLAPGVTRTVVRAAASTSTASKPQGF